MVIFAKKTGAFMEIVEVDAREYSRLLPQPRIAFNSTAFNSLNAGKIAGLKHLVFGEGKSLMGLIAGIDCEGVLRAPFSAPFASFESNCRQRLEHYMAAAASLSEWLSANRLTARITLPPSCYSPASDPDLMNRQMLALLAAPGAEPAWTDFNYHFELSQFPRISELMTAKAAAKLRAAMRNSMTFHCDTSLENAYSVIIENHRYKGFPTHMTLDDLRATSEIIRIECFEIRKDGETAAAAIVYHTAPHAVQVIYWGDRPEMRRFKPMNMLAPKIFEYYSQLGMHIFDLGPASSGGVPSEGLCTFKEGCGCQLTPKPTIVIKP